MCHCSKSRSLCTLMQAALCGASLASCEVIVEAPALEVPQLPATVLQTLRTSLEARPAGAELCKAILLQHPELTVLGHRELQGAVDALLSGLLCLRADALGRAANGLAACGHLVGFRWPGVECLWLPRG